MNRSGRFLTVEHALYLALFVLALALRLYLLGAHPLTDHEAREALVAHRLIRGPLESASAPGSPAYLMFTYLSFLIFGASEATARLAPAVLGAGVIFIPALFRDRLGREAALLTSGLLALSAGLVAAARSADGAILSLLGLGIGLGALRRYVMTTSPVWVIVGGAALGAGSAAGTTFLTGAFVLMLTGLVGGWSSPEVSKALQESWARVRAQGTSLLVSFGLAALIVSTVGGVYLRGLGALADTWAAWPAGFWPSTAGRPPVIIPMFMLVYEPLVLVLGIVGAVRAFRVGHGLGQALAWFSLIAFALVVLYSGRTQFDMIWIVAPLTGLAAWVLVEIASDSVSEAKWPLVAAQVGMIAAMAGFAALNFASYAELAREGQSEFYAAQTVILGQTVTLPSWTQLGMSALALALTLAMSYLLGMGFSWPSAKLGLTLGAAGVLLAMSLASSWGLNHAGTRRPAELWWDWWAADDVHRLLATLGSVSNYSLGYERDIQVTVHAPGDGTLGWALRDFPHARFVDRLDPLVTDPVVITPADEENPTLGSAYVGQAFSLRATWTPSLTAPQWAGWLVFRRAPTVQSERVILWVRQDIQELPGPGP